MKQFRRGDVSIAYEQFGTEGSPILAIQGSGCAGNTWRPQAEALSRQHRVLLFDNRGIGQSADDPKTPLSVSVMAEDALGLMAEVGWSSCHVLGHSLGGLIAQELALRHPKRIKSLCLMCTGARGADITQMSWSMLKLGIRTRLGSRAMRRRAALEMIFTEDYLRQEDTSQLAHRIAPLLGRDLADNPAIILRQLRAMSRYDSTLELAKLAGIPTLVVSGDQDLVTPPALGRRLAEAIPGARFELLSPGAHAVTLERPEQTCELLGAFFAAHDGASGTVPQPRGGD